MYESPEGCKQNTDLSNTLITWIGSSHLFLGLQHLRNLQAFDEETHWSIISPLTEKLEPGLGAPTKKNKALLFS